MTYREKDSIRSVIEGFFDTGVVDEIIVVNNNAEEGTSEEVQGTGAREVMEPRQGYGHASRRGLAEAQGDLVVLCEPDGTFLPRDIMRLLALSADFDVVFGSRTTRQGIWDGANMALPLRWGNWAVAKLMTVLFRTSHLSDVGCTYRLLRRAVVLDILPKLTIGGSQFGPELMMRTIVDGWRYVETPVNYLPRVGRSAVTGEMTKAVALGLQMILLILRIRLGTLGRRRRPPMLRLSTSAAAPSERDLVRQRDGSLPAGPTRGQRVIDLRDTTTPVDLPSGGAR